MKILLFILLLSLLSHTPVRAQMPGLYLDYYLPYVSVSKGE